MNPEVTGHHVPRNQTSEGNTHAIGEAQCHCSDA